MGNEPERLPDSTLLRSFFSLSLSPCRGEESRDDPRESESTRPKDSRLKKVHGIPSSRASRRQPPD
jgi:hypothetical protein